MEEENRQNDKGPPIFPDTKVEQSIKGTKNIKSTAIYELPIESLQKCQVQVSARGGNREISRYV